MLSPETHSFVAINRVLLGVLVLSLLATPVLAHVPEFPADNTSPEQAVEVSDAAKSWSFHDRLDTGAVKYYRLSLSTGQRLQVSTFTPERSQFTPSIVLMSRSLNRTDPVPSGVAVPDGMGTLVIDGTRPESASYEPFAPSANYQTSNSTRSIQTETTYVIAIYEPANRSGPAGVAIGYQEEFSPTEYVTVPYDLVRTQLWAGQHPLLVLGPIAIILVAGLGLLHLRIPDRRTQPRLRYGLGIAALLIIASGVNTFIKMGIALTATGFSLGTLVTMVFIGIPILCGSWILRTVFQSAVTPSIRTRVGFVITGTLAVATWAGFLIGPGIILFIAAMPSRVFDQ